MRPMVSLPTAAFLLTTCAGHAAGQAAPNGTYTFTGSASCLVSQSGFQSFMEDTRQKKPDFIGSLGLPLGGASIVSKNLTGTFNFLSNDTGQRIARGVYNTAPKVASGANAPYNDVGVGAFVLVEDFRWGFARGVSTTTPGLTPAIPGLVLEFSGSRKMFFYEGAHASHVLTITTPPQIMPPTSSPQQNNQYTLRNFSAGQSLTLGTMSASQSLLVLDTSIDNYEVCWETDSLESTSQTVPAVTSFPPQ